jgi:hypothetical protein
MVCFDKWKIVDEIVDDNFSVWAGTIPLLGEKGGWTSASSWFDSAEYLPY